jgi:nicotinamide mononucleotide transporter
MFMAVYGFLNIPTEWVLKSLPWTSHILAIATGILLMLLLSRVLRKKTSSKKTLLDAFTTIFSIIATWLMVNYVHENWLYWIIIDAAAIYLYINRKMYLGAGLFGLYCLMAIDGYFSLGIFT